MDTTLGALSLSIVLGVGLLVGIGALSLFSGALNFLFVKPKIAILKSQFGKQGFAFSFSWDQSAEAICFDRMKIQLFNPFGSPTQVNIPREFDPSEQDFARDLDLGPKMQEIFNAKGLEKATVEIEVSSSRDQITQKFLMKATDFVKKYSTASLTSEEINKTLNVPSDKPKFTIPGRTFISPPLDGKGKKLKIATNPEFTAEFTESTGSAGASAPAAASFSVTKVWIEPGCIVCNACEGIAPLIFEVTEKTCLIRAGAPLNEGLKIQEAAEACPVEVIKFIRAS